ncbi:MAG: hypothetical protein M0035_17540 [Actinomycetota bacterium]|jgi:hypothetical protein|nr:hypothetical protein [Actinomycetota bacterium]
MEVVPEPSYQASGLHLPMSASYGRFHRVWDMGTYSSEWFQPAARVPAMHLVLPLPEERVLKPGCWALSCAEGRNQVIVTTREKEAMTNTIQADRLLPP